MPSELLGHHNTSTCPRLSTPWPFLSLPHRTVVVPSMSSTDFSSLPPLPERENQVNSLGLSAYAPPLSPPVTPHSNTLSLPLPTMATAMLSSASTLGAPPDATPFESHILSLLSLISQHPSPSFPFPAGANASQPKPDATLAPYDGKKTEAQLAIEAALIDLGGRVWAAEREKKAPSDPTQSQSNAAGGNALGPGRGQAPYPTPDWTPPATESELSESQDTLSSFKRPPSGQNPSFSQTSMSHPLIAGSIASHPLSASLSTPASHISMPRQSGHAPHSILTTASGASVLTGGPAAAGWPQRGSISESGMTAEKELELLKAQVQDIARVCKVSLRLARI